MQMKLTRRQRIVHRFLITYDSVDSSLERSLTMLEKAESRRSSITGSIEGMGLSHGQSDTMTDSLVAMDEAVVGIKDRANRFYQAATQVEDFIAEVQRRDSAAGKVLGYVYVDRLSSSDIANKLGYSSRNVYFLLKKGLDIGFEVLASLEEGGD